MEATFDFEGEPNTGDVNLALAYTNHSLPNEDGWHLVANPYPCAIDWKLVSKSAGVSPFAYIYNAMGTGNFVTIDASFISLKILLPVVRKWGQGQALILVKPQFEAERKETARGKGVVRDPDVHRRVLLDVLTFGQGNGFQIKGLARSPLLGPKGNVEFLGWLGFNTGGSSTKISIEKLVSGVIDIE